MKKFHLEAAVHQRVEKILIVFALWEDSGNLTFDQNNISYYPFPFSCFFFLTSEV